MSLLAAFLAAAAMVMPYGVFFYYILLPAGGLLAAFLAAAAIVMPYGVFFYYILLPAGGLPCLIGSSLL